MDEPDFEERMANTLTNQDIGRYIYLPVMKLWGHITHVQTKPIGVIVNSKVMVDGISKFGRTQLKADTRVKITKEKN